MWRISGFLCGSVAPLVVLHAASAPLLPQSSQARTGILIAIGGGDLCHVVILFRRNPVAAARSQGVAFSSRSRMNGSRGGSLRETTRRRSSFAAAHRETSSLVGSSQLLAAGSRVFFLQHGGSLRLGGVSAACLRGVGLAIKTRWCGAGDRVRPVSLLFEKPGCSIAQGGLLAWRGAGHGDLTARGGQSQ